MAINSWFRRSAAPAPVSPEARLAELLTELHSSGGADRKQAERDLLAWVDGHLRNNLKHIMLHTFGAQVTNGQSLQFTALWNDVVLKALDRGLDGVQRESSIRSLTTYFSVALANQARDYLRRRKLGEQILDGAIRPLVEQREKHLQEKHRLDFETVLETADRWYQQGEPMGDVLRFYYVDGLSYAEIAAQMNRSSDQVKHLKKRALEALKQLGHEGG